MCVATPETAWIALLSSSDPRRKLFDTGLFSVDCLTGWAAETIGDMARLMIGRTGQLPIDLAMELAAHMSVAYQSRAVLPDGSQLSLCVQPLAAAGGPRLRVV